MLSDDFDMDSSLVVSLISIVISMILVGVFIFSHFRTEYVDPGRALSVRLSVCLSVCLSVTAFYLNTMGPISMKLGPHDLNKNLR